MANPDVEQEFKFPDEQETQQKQVDSEATPELEVEIVDDTPPQDKGREPLPEKIVKELEDDDLEEYSEKVKKRLSQMKKVWHDERRAKESAAREREEALRFAEAKEREVKELRQRLGVGEKLFKEEATKAATTELAAAKDKLRKAYESNDPDQIADAQEALTDAKLRLRDVERFKPSLQHEERSVEPQQQTKTAPQIDPKAQQWRAKNEWFGANKSMTGFVFGLHEELVLSGVDPRSDEYYRRVDETMRKRFPDYFEGEESEKSTQTSEVEVEKPAPRTKPNVVAPATRSTAPKKVRLTQTQLALAKRFGLTPEAYAKELLKLENANG